MAIWTCFGDKRSGVQISPPRLNLSCDAMVSILGFEPKYNCSSQFKTTVLVVDAGILHRIVAPGFVGSIPI